MTQATQSMFRELKIKCTKQRSFILEFFQSRTTPCSAEEVYMSLKQVDKSINLSTVYRILDVFTEKGIVLKSIHQDQQKAVFELNTHDHSHHLICLACKKVVVVDGCPFEHYEHDLEQTTQFHIINHKLEFYGYCEGCFNTQTR